MNQDAEQLREYADSGSQEAFAAIVQRYLPLVYRAALHRVNGDVHRAEDVTQLAFVALARNAAAVARHPDLTGWLFTTTRFLALKALRTERRRSFREQEAYLMQTAAEKPSHPPAAEPAQAVLDDVMMELRDLDRQVLLLRFYRGLRLAEIGAHLDVTENAVQKRVDRALDQLKDRLARRGVTSTASALAVALELQASAAVPASLAAASISAAMTCGTASAGTLGVTTLMAVSKLQIAATAAVLLTGTGALFWTHQGNLQLRAEFDRRAIAAAGNAAQLRQEITAVARRDGGSAAEPASAPLPATRTAATTPQALSLAYQQVREYAATVRERGRQLRADGRLEEALELYLEAYRGLRAMPDQVGTAELQGIMSQLADLGKTFQSATAALQRFRDAAAAEMLAASPDTSPQARSAAAALAVEFAALNLRLKEDVRTIALFDSLPTDDPRRQPLGSVAYDHLVEARRYRDALVGRSFAGMLSQLEKAQPGDRAFVVGYAMKDIEVLTGAGLPDEARMLTAKLLSYSDTESIRASIAQRVARASESAAP